MTPLEWIIILIVGLIIYTIYSRKKGKKKKQIKKNLGKFFIGGISGSAFFIFVALPMILSQTAQSPLEALLEAGILAIVFIPISFIIGGLILINVWKK